MKHIALVCKLMPLYRLGVFHELSKIEDHHITCFGDTKQEGGIEIIPWSKANNIKSGGINWIKTSNYFYISERLLWQTGIIKTILFSKYDYFIFEGAVFHLPTWLFAILIRLRGKKVLFWTHGFKGNDRGIKKIIRTIYFKLANGLLLYGNYSKNIMIKNGFDANKLFVIYNSLDTTKQINSLNNIDLQLISGEKAKHFIDPYLLTIIFIGRLVKEKNISFVINAVKILGNMGQPINCIIIGDGPEMDSIKSFITLNNLENNIYLTGSIYEESVICKYFQMADIMVSPGNVGLNCMHSLTYGVPVLTHNNFRFQNPEVEAIIPGETGLLFQYNNFNDLILKIIEWKNNKISKIEIQKKCQQIILDRYNPKKHAENIIKALNNI